MSARLHDLVHGLLFRNAKKNTDVTLFGSLTNVREGAFRTVCKRHFHIPELLDKTMLNDMAEDSRVLRDPFRCFENCFYCDLLQCQNDSAKESCCRGVE